MASCKPGVRLTLLDGTAHAFSVNGLNLQGRIGSSIDLEAKGEVYNLPQLGDFAGTYRRAIGGVDPERPTNTLIPENDQSGPTSASCHQNQVSP